MSIMELLAVIATFLVFWFVTRVYEEARSLHNETKGHHTGLIFLISHAVSRITKPQVSDETPRETSHETRRDETPETFDFDYDDDSENNPNNYPECNEGPEEEIWVPQPTDMSAPTVLPNDDNPCKAWVRKQMLNGLKSPVIVARGVRDFKYSKAQMYRYIDAIRKEQ